jgi:hypothetical protein
MGAPEGPVQRPHRLHVPHGTHPRSFARDGAPQGGQTNHASKGTVPAGDLPRRLSCHCQKVVASGEPSVTWVDA